MKQWKKHPEQLAVLKEAYAKNAISLTAMREATKAGKITQEVKRRTDQECIRGLANCRRSPCWPWLSAPDTARDYIEKGESRGNSLTRNQNGDCRPI